VNTIMIYYLDIFGEVFTVSLYRVFLGAALFFSPFVACAIGLWISGSSLFIFTGQWGSKFAAVAVFCYGINVSFGVFFALGEGHSEYATFEMGLHK
jgi:hypothetical protein